MKGRDLRNGNHVATLRRLSFAESGRLCDSNGHIFNVFCFRRRWWCKCSHCESLGFSITNGWLRVDWAHQTCNLHALRSTKRLREAEDLRGFCVAFSASRLLTFSSAHMSASTWPQQPFLGSSRTSRRQPARTSSRNHLSTIEVGAVVTARCACCSSTEDCPLGVAPI